MTTSLLLLLTVAILHVHETVSHRVVGSYTGSSTWRYIDKFCFLPEGENDSTDDASRRGKLEGMFYFPKSDLPSPSMFLYYKGEDEGAVLRKEWGAWERVYAAGLTCEEKYEVANSNGMVFNMLGSTFPKTLYEVKNQRAITSTENVTSTTIEDRFNGMDYWGVHVKATMKTTRPRWFFISVGNCAPGCANTEVMQNGNRTFCAAGVDIQYNLNLTNGNSYASADEDWNLDIIVAFFVGYILLCGFGVRNHYYLAKIRKLHPSVKLLNASVFVYWLYLAVYLFQLLKYEATGFKPDWLTYLGSVFAGWSEFLLLLHVILVGKGWTIVRRKISPTGRVKIAVFMTAYIVIYFSCVIYFVNFVDPGQITYFYDTPPGLILVALRVFAFFWFSYAVQITMKKYKAKLSFYRKYWLFVSVWLLSLPAYVVINNAIDIWARAKVMLLLQTLTGYVIHLVLLIMYNPKTLFGIIRVTKSFPFHATTVAMLRVRRGSDLTENETTNAAAADVFSGYHIDRASELAQKVRQGVVMLQNYTSD